MAKPKNLSLWDWNVAVEGFHGESDRGAAVLAGGFVENYLAIFLRAYTVDAKVTSEIFDAMGPLSSFSQRTAVARAFGFMSKGQYEDLTLIRKIRNHFAHHPLDTSFATPEVQSLCLKLSQLSVADESSPRNEAEHNRRAFLFSCTMFCGQAHLKMEKDGRLPPEIDHEKTRIN